MCRVYSLCCFLLGGDFITYRVGVGFEIQGLGFSRQEQGLKGSRPLTAKDLALRRSRHPRIGIHIFPEILMYPLLYRPKPLST